MRRRFETVLIALSVSLASATALADLVLPQCNSSPYCERDPKLRKALENSFVREGKVLVEGTAMGREDVLRVATRYHQQFHRCYARRLLRRPALEGELSLKFVIGPSGRAQNVKLVRSDLGDTKLESCVRGIVREWRWLSKPDSDVVVLYPMRFWLNRDAK